MGVIEALAYFVFGRIAECRAKTRRCLCVAQMITVDQLISIASSIGTFLAATATYMTITQLAKQREEMQHQREEMRLQLGAMEKQREESERQRRASYKPEIMSSAGDVRLGKVSSNMCQRA
jgi:hypothetical protein